MSSFTKKAIMEAFLRLVGKKPLDKITVRDIVDECGINRNTFYYHFQDMYAVLEGYCQELIDRLPTDASLSDTLNSYLTVMSNFAVENPRSTHGLVVSLGYDGFYRYLAPGLQKVIMECLLRAQIKGAREYLRHLTVFICHGVIGLSVDLLKSGSSVIASTLSDDISRMLTQLERSPEEI
ncbi:MAG: TetR family transcriptional regulator [Clostridia bacterium]|nr:TetR family transcriptional regulator [Clostridia bacterium]